METADEPKTETQAIDPSLAHNRFLNPAARLPRLSTPQKKEVAKAQAKVKNKTTNNWVAMLDAGDMLMVMRSHALSAACQDENGEVVWPRVASKMGWTMKQLADFRKANSSLIAISDELSNNESPDTERQVPLEPDNPGTKANLESQMSRAIALIEANLLTGLRSIGFNPKESRLVMARASFNKIHFVESLDSICTGSLVLYVKLQKMQEQVERRLTAVRKIIEDYGEFQSPEREMFLREERSLMTQYLNTGQLLNQIQQTSYHGAAQLAVIRARMRGDKDLGPPRSDRTQRSNKPGFRPSIVITQDAEMEETTTDDQRSSETTPGSDPA